MSTTWTCQRVAQGKVCRFQNPGIKRNCVSCGKPRPKKRKPAHMAALEEPYEVYVQANGGSEDCGICGRPRGARKHQRDHEHEGEGKPRGLLCPVCNRNLVAARYGLKMTPEWLRAAADYLERAEAMSDQTSPPPTGVRPDEKATALVLTQEGWDDLAVICGFYEWETRGVEGDPDFTVVGRRRNLCKRVKEAADA